MVFVYLDVVNYLKVRVFINIIGIVGGRRGGEVKGIVDGK